MALFGYSIWDLLPKKTTEEFWGNELEAEAVRDQNEALEAHQQILKIAKDFMQTDDYKNASEEDQQLFKQTTNKILSELQPSIKQIDQFNEAVATNDENRRRQRISRDTVSKFDELNDADGLLGNITGQAFYALTDAGKNAYENTINQAKTLGSIGANLFGAKDTAKNLADEVMQSQMDMNAIMTPAEYNLDNGILGSQNIRFATNSASQLASLIGSPVNVAVSKGVGALASGLGKVTGLTSAAEKFFGAAAGSGAEGIAAASNGLLDLSKVPQFFGAGLNQVSKEYAKGMLGYALGKTASALPTWASMSLPELYKDALEYDENGNVVIPDGERMAHIATLAIPHAVIENFGINPQSFGTVAERLTFKQYLKQYLKALAEEPSEELYQNWIGKIEKEWGKEDPNTGKKQNLANAIYKASQQFSSTDKQQLQENLNEALGGFFGALAMFPADHKLATTKYLQMQEQYRQTLDNIAKGVDQQAKLLEDMGIADFSNLRQSQQDLEEVGRLIQAEEQRLKENKFESNDDRRTCIQQIATLKQQAAQIGAELQDAAENTVKDYAAGVDILNQMQEDYINQQLAGEAQINPSDNILMPRIDQAKEAGQFDTSKYQPQIDQNIKTYKGKQQLFNEALKKRDELEAKNPKLKEERLAVEAENQKKIDEENAKGKPKSRSKAELDRLMEEYRNGDFVGNFNDFLRAKDAEEAQAEQDIEAEAQKEFGNTETRDQKPAPEGFRYSKDQDGKIILERDPNFRRSEQDLSSEALKTGKQTAEGLKNDRSTKIGNETIYDTKKDAEYAAAKMLEQDIKDGKVKQGTKLGEKYNAVKTKYGYVIREAKKAEPRTKTLNGKNAVDKSKAEKKIAAINDKLQKRKKKNKKGKNVKVVLVEDQKQIPNFQTQIVRNAVTGVYEKAATYVEGASDQNGNETTIYIVRNNIEDEKKLDSIITHELVHAGLRNVLNKNQQRYLLHEVSRLLSQDRSFRDKILPEMTEYSDLLSAENIIDNNGLNIYLEEVLARLAETIDADEEGITGKIRKMWNNIVSMFYRALRSLGLTTNLSKAEIPEILKGLRFNLTGVGDLYHFSRSQYGYDADAKAMFRADNMKKAIDKLAKRGDLVSYDIDGKPMFSLRTWEDGGRSVLAQYLKTAVAKKELSDKDAKSLLKSMDDIYKECRIMANKDPESEFGKWSKVGVDYDSEGKPYFTVVRQNGDYAMNIDFSTVCKKRRALNNVLNEIVKRGLLTEHGDLTRKDIVDIQEAIKAHGFEVACALCFVDSKRYAVGEMAKSLVNRWNEMFRSYKEGTDLYKNTMKELREKKSNTRNQNQRIAEAISSDNKEDYEKDGTHKYRRELTIDWLISSGSREMLGGHDNLAKNYPRIFEVLNGYGSGKSKNSHMDVAWNNDIVKSFNARNNPNVESFNPKKAFSVGGVRIQSFSDFIPTMFFDYVQCISELEAKGLPCHVYTKEADFVKLFGSCGLKTNMSFVYAEGGCRKIGKAEYDRIRKEKGDAYVTSFKEKGKTRFYEYLYTDLDPQHPQSFNPEEAFRLRADKRYEDNCGTIAVGVSDEHVRTLLRDPRIDMVIPYHKSGIAPEVAIMRKISNYTDYSIAQTEKDKSTGRMTKKHFDFYADLAKTNDPKQTAKNYLQWSKDNDVIPKYAKFSDEENYYKLLADFRLYKKDDKGNEIYIPQKAVKLNLNKDWQQVLTAALDVNQKVADRFNADIDSLVKDCRKILKANKEFAEAGKSENTRFSLGGMNAQTANIQNYENAMKMLEEGKSAQDVWFNTGWYVAKDGKPRFEISDKEYDVTEELKNARIDGDITVNKNNQQMMLNTEYPINKIIKHDALFKAYPELEQIRVNLYEDAESKSRGSFGGKNISINLSKMLGEDGTIDPKKIKRTLIHELQHGIQRIEGFAVGSSKSSEKNVLKAEYGRRHTFTQEELDDIEVKADDRYRRHYGEGEARAVADRLRYYDKDKESGEFLRKYGNMPEQDFDYDVDNSIIAHDENFVNQKTRFSKRSAEIDKQLTPAQIKNRQLNNAAEPMSNLVTLQGTTIKRYKDKVGKFVTDMVFVHKNYAREVIPSDLLDKAEKILKEKKPDFDYKAIRWNTKTGEIRFDEAPNFDTAPEPVAGNTVAISSDGKVTEKYSPNIWHHKWMWVKDDYKGFDIKESWERSRKWLNGLARLNIDKTHPDYSVSNRGIANGSAYGYGAWNNQLKYYGLDDLADDPKNVLPEDAPKPKSKTRYSLRTVKPVYPSSEAWYRGKTLAEYKKQGYPIFETASDDALSEAQKDAIDSKNGASGTANTSTIPTYKKLFEDLKKNDPNWNKMRILDASSGLGQGTIIGRDMGFNVTDLEPFVSKDKYGRKAGDRPAYEDYDLLEKKIESGELEKFDYVISNAVLNVLPQDERDNMVAALSHLVRDGGKIFINTIGKDYQTAKDAKEPTAKNSKGQPYWKISKSGNPTGSNLITEAKGDTGREVFVWASNSPQKVFSKTELTAYLKDALGDDFVISNTPKGIGNTAVVLTKKESKKDLFGNPYGRAKKGRLYSLRNMWTGTSADYEKPSTEYVNSGEGSQVFGWGLYATSLEGIARGYAESDYIRKTMDAEKKAKPSYTLKKAAKESIAKDYLEVIFDRLKQSNPRTKDDFRSVITRNLSSIIWRLEERSLAPEEKEALNELGKIQKELDLDENNKALDKYFGFKLKKDKFKKNLYRQTAFDGKNENLLDWYENIDNERRKHIYSEFIKYIQENYGDWEWKPLGYNIAIDAAKQHLKNVGLMYKGKDISQETGEKVYHWLQHQFEKFSGEDAPEATSKFLYSIGIDGIKYPVNSLQGNNRSYDDGFNIVVFNDKDLKVDEHIRYSLRSTDKEYAQAVKDLGNTDELKTILNNALKNNTLGKAPNREQSNLSPAQWLITRTRNFKRWFGDWENNPESSSKVVDENGEPLVVYHGTEAEFNTFDRTKTRANMDIQGNFFSPYRIEAAGYGSNVKSFFINIKNPADEGTGYKALKSHQGENYAGKKAAENLMNKGYDGVINYDEFIVFDSSNIKLADKTTYDDFNKPISLSERYDKKKNDMRFSLRTADPFYSNTLDALNRADKKLPESQKAQSWLSKLSNLWHKEEAEWMGLPQWLKSFKPTDKVTKQQIVDFINANQVKINEVNFSDSQSNEVEDRVRDKTLDFLKKIFDKDKHKKYLQNLESMSEEEAMQEYIRANEALPHEEGSGYETESLKRFESPEELNRVFEDSHKNLIDLSKSIEDLGNKNSYRNLADKLIKKTEDETESKQIAKFALGKSLKRIKLSAVKVLDSVFANEVNNRISALSLLDQMDSINKSISDPNLGIQDNSIIKEIKTIYDKYVKNIDRDVIERSRDVARALRGYGELLPDKPVYVENNFRVITLDGLQKVFSINEAKHLTYAVRDFVETTRLRKEANEMWQKELSKKGIDSRRSLIEEVHINDVGDLDHIHLWVEPSRNLKDMEEYFELNKKENKTSYPIEPIHLDYTTDGLENKREIAFTFPAMEGGYYPDAAALHFADKKHSNKDIAEGKTVVWTRFGDYVDEDGSKILVVDEIQSALHQDARERGYKEKNESIIDGNAVPDAPFKQTYDQLAMKRLLRLAAEEGYAGLALITPEQQNVRNYSTDDEDEDSVKRQRAYKAFYGERIPNFLNKFLKPFGVKVKNKHLDLLEIHGNNPEEAATAENWQYVEITPEMRETFTKKGMPLFSLRNVDGSKKTNEELWREQQAKFSKIIQDKLDKEKNPQKKTLRENLAYMADRAEYNFTNKRFYLKKWQTDLEKNLADDPDYADLFENGRLKDKFDLHMMFDTYHGKVQTKRDRFTEEFWDPIFDSVTKNGVKYDDLNRYLFARHAEERDRHVQSINPEYAKEGHGSGWNDDWGTPDEVMESIEKKYGKAVMQDIGTKFDKLNDKLLDWQVRYHLISKETAEAMRNAYKHYTPLKRFDDYIRGGWDEDPHELNISQDIRAKALGRKSAPEHMLTFVKANIDTVFRRGERNLINLALLDLALRTNDPIFDVNRKLVKRVSKDGEVEYVRDLTGDKEQTVGVRDGDKYYTVHIGNREIYNAFDNDEMKGNEIFEALVHSFRGITSTMGANATSRNIEFGLVNLDKDQQQALAENLVYRSKKGDFWNFAKNAIKNIPSAANTFIKYTMGKDDADTRMFREFLENGGSTGYMDIYRLVDDAKDLEARIDEATLGFFEKWKKWKDQGKITQNMIAKAKEVTGRLLKPLELINDLFEQTTRFANYKTARKFMSAARAAELSKNLTLNFNRHGKMWKSQWNWMYMFSNASLQGTAKTMRMYEKAFSQNATPEQRKAARSILMFSFGAGIMAEILGHAFSKKDDDDLKYYDKLEASIKDNNVVIMNPASKSGKNYIKLPLFIGGAFPYMMGRNAAAMMIGSQSIAQSVSNVVQNMEDYFSPLGTAAPNKEGKGDIVKKVAPTSLRPFLDVSYNSNFAGSRIYAQSMNSNKPAYTRAFKKTPMFYVELSRLLSKITGGNTLEKGSVDIPPEAIQHIVESYAGGTGKFVGRTLETARKILKGEELDTGNIPIVRRFTDDVGDSHVYDEFRKIQEVYRTVTTAEKDRNKELLEKYPKHRNLVNLMKRYNPRLTRLDKKLERNQIDMDTYRSEYVSILKQINKDGRKYIQQK